MDDHVFRIPHDYSRIGGQSSDQARRQYEDDDDQLLQYAIRQSVNGESAAAAAPGSRAESRAANASSNGDVAAPAAPKKSDGKGKGVQRGEGGGEDNEEVDIWEALQVGSKIDVF